MSQKQEGVEGWVARSEVTHEQETSLTHDLPPRDVVKTLREFLDRQNVGSDEAAPKGGKAKAGRS